MGVEQSGTQTCTNGTTHTLGTPVTTDKIRELRLDLNTLLLGESIEVWCEVKVLSGGTARVYNHETYPGGSAQPIVTTTPVYSPYGHTWKIRVTSAANRDIPWSENNLN